MKDKINFCFVCGSKFDVVEEFGDHFHQCSNDDCGECYTSNTVDKDINLTLIHSTYESYDED